MKDTVDVEKYLNTPRGKRKKFSKWIEDYLSFMSSNFDNKEIWFDSSFTSISFKSLYVSFFCEVLLICKWDEGSELLPIN